MDPNAIPDKSQAIPVQLEDGVHYYDPISGEELLEYFEPDFMDEDDDEREERPDAEKENERNREKSEEKEQTSEDGAEGGVDGAESEMGEGGELGSEAGAETTEFGTETLGEVALDGAETAGTIATGAEIAEESGAATTVAATSEVWGPVLAGCAAIAVVLVITIVFFTALMSITKDQATANPINSSAATLNGTTVGQQVVAKAITALGSPYVWGACHGDPASSACKSFDCSGLVNWAWYWGSDKKFNLHGAATPELCSLKDNKNFQVIPNFSAAIPGDILVWDYSSGCNGHIHHTALYIGGGKYIQAPSSGDVVKISKLADRHETALILRPVIK